jgi:hypothetical protein
VEVEGYFEESNDVCSRGGDVKVEAYFEDLNEVCSRGGDVTSEPISKVRQTTMAYEYTPGK